MRELPQALLLNPGTDFEFDHHVGVPFLSQFHVNVGITGITVSDIFADDGIDINDKVGAAIQTLDNRDLTTFTQQLELFNFGWRNQKGTYFSGGIYQELDFIGYFPKDYAVLAYEGNANAIGRRFNLGDIKSRAEMLMVYHFGFTKRENSNFIWGLRGKIYSEMFSYRATQSQGTFLTLETEDGPNIYQHRISNLDIKVQTAGYASIRDADSENRGEEVRKDLIRKALLGGNLGVGLDAGFTYKLQDNLTWTGSINDLGVIFHTKDVESYLADGEYVYDGFETPTNNLGRPNINFIDDLKSQVDLDTLSNGYTTMRSLKMYSSLRYDFNMGSGRGGQCYCFGKDYDRPEYSSAFGIQTFLQTRPRGAQLAGSLFYYQRIAYFLRLKAMYTIDRFSATNLGLLTTFHLGPVNLYAGFDNILALRNIAGASSANVQAGMNVSF